MNEIADVVILIDYVGGGSVPAVSTWGMIVMLLALLVVATVLMKHQGSASNRRRLAI